MIELWLSPDDPRPRHRYRLAGGHTVRLDHRFTALEPFRVDTAPEPGARSASVPWDALRSGRELHDERGWLGGRWRRVTARRLDGTTLLDVAGFGELAVLDGGAIVFGSSTVGAPEALSVEIAVGPALLLALARAGTFALHASAFVPAAGSGRGAVAVSGASGNGKSTLAAAAELAGGTRLTDDILPLATRSDPTTVAAAPHFPQLKLPAAAQYRGDQPATVPLRALCLLDSFPAETPPDAAPSAGPWPEVERLGRREALLALAAQAVSAKLFDPILHAALLDTLVTLTTQLPIHRLRFPRHPSLVPAVLAAIGTT